MHVLKTIEDMLGIEPLGLNDSSVEPMTAIFDRAAEARDYQVIVPGVLRTTKLPLPRRRLRKRRAQVQARAATRGHDMTRPIGRPNARHGFFRRKTGWIRRALTASSGPG